LERFREREKREGIYLIGKEIGRDFSTFFSRERDWEKILFN